MDEDRLVEMLKARLHYSETTGGDYGAINNTAKPGTKPTYALGKYQFVPSIWWKGSKGIVEFAKTKKYNKGEEIDYDFFLNTQSLQEEFFSFYVKDSLIGTMKTAMKNNVRNFSPDQLLQMAHINPKATIAYAAGGEWKIQNQINNTEITEYLAKGQKGLNELGVSNTKSSDLLTPAEKTTKVNDYFTEREKLVKEFDSNKSSEGAFKDNMTRLNQRYHNEGLTDDINIEAGRKTAIGTSAWNSERAATSELFGLLSNKKEIPNLERVYNSKTNKITLQAKNKAGKLILDDLLKKSSGALREDKQYQTPDTNTTTINRDNFSKSIINSDKRSITFDLSGKQGNGKFLFEKLNKFNTGEKPITKETFAPKKNVVNKKKFITGQDANIKVKMELGKAYTPGLLDSFVDTSTLLPPALPNFQEGKVNKTFKEAQTEAEATVQTEAVTPTEIAKGLKPKSVNELLEFTDEVAKPNFLEYDKTQYKKEIPFQAAAQGLLAAMGIAGADRSIPERNEQVSAGFLDYINKINEISRMGLPPELEADAKNSMSSAYQLGMQNIVKASGGNRNLVLGNQSQLDVAKMQQEGQLAVADWQAKNDATNQLGEAMKYVNEFNARRDIANDEMKQNLAFQDRQASGQLAAAGFSGMMQSIQESNERAPGSPYHMMMSKYAMDAFGFDPNKKDDGSGKQGTRSAFLNQGAKTNEYNQNRANIASQYVTMTDEKKIEFDKAFQNNSQNLSGLSNLADIISSSELNTLNLNNTGQALKTGNFDIMKMQSNNVAPTNVVPPAPVQNQVQAPQFIDQENPLAFRKDNYQNF